MNKNNTYRAFILNIVLFLALNLNCIVKPEILLVKANDTTINKYLNIFYVQYVFSFKTLTDRIVYWLLINIRYI